MKKKKIFDQDVGLLEACLESVPSAFIISFISIVAFKSENINNNI